MYTNANLKIPVYFGLICKHYPENVTFSFLRILKLFTREVCTFLKK